MSDFLKTKTANNLLKAFAGESQARNRYTYYGGVAKKQGFLQIANIFIETADNEKEHAKLFYKKLLEKGLDGEAIVLDGAGYPIALTDDTLKNLGYAAGGEKEEWTELYPSFAKIADEEGFPDVAVLFRLIARIEEKHEARFVKLAKSISESKVFTKDSPVAWKCQNCGFVLDSATAPEICPACKHPKMYFEVHIENY
jgi:rubrerythrin